MEYFVEWVKAAVIRALKTFAQALIAALPTTAATLGSVDWPMALSIAGLAAVLSLLTSIAGLPEVKAGSENVELAAENEALLKMLEGKFELKTDDSFDNAVEDVLDE